jgi:hypothetical protein
MCFFSPVTANCQRKRILRKTDGLCLLRLYFFFLFLSPGKLRAEQTANEKNNNNKEKKKKILGLGFYSDPSIDFAVCFFAYSCCCCCVSLWAGELLVVG